MSATNCSGARKSALCNCKIRIFISVIVFGGSYSHVKLQGLCDESLIDGSNLQWLENITWNQLLPGERLQTLQLIIDQTKGNYEKIWTWQGKLNVELEQFLSPQYLSNSMGNLVSNEVKLTGLTQEFHFVTAFAIDLALDSAFRSTETTMLKNVQPGSDNPIVIENQISGDNRSIVTPEKYVYFDPRNVGSWSVIPDNPLAQNKPAAHRVATADAEHKSLGQLIDPRNFFSFNPDGNYWDELSLYADALNGKSGKELQEKAEEILTIEQAKLGEHALYRITMIISPSDGSTELMTTVWSAAASFNPLMMTLIPKGGSEPRKALWWHWKLFDGVVLPLVTDQTIRANHTITYHRKVELKDCLLNAKLDAHQFDYKALGLKNGDLVLDDVEKTVFVMDNSQPTRLAGYGEKYAGIGSPSSSRTLLIIGNIILVIILGGLMLLRREVHVA